MTQNQTMTGELLQNVRIIDPVCQTDRVADVLIADGLIQAIQPQITLTDNDITPWDCQGMILGPGLIDLYSYTGEPGFEARETLASFMAAAEAGGFTRVGILPDTLPPVDTPAMVSLFHQNIQSLPGCHPQAYLWGGLTQNLAGTQMTELAELAQTHLIGFAQGQPLQDLVLLRQLLDYVKPFHRPIALYCCHHPLTLAGVMREGSLSIQTGLPGIPVYAETAALSTVLELVKSIQTPVHLMRISTAGGVALIQQAKAQNLPVTASTTWVHLLLNTTAIAGQSPPIIPYDPSLNLDPPLGNLADQQALIEGVKTGILDAIAIDHRPYTYEEKTVAFADAPPGGIGLELALPLLWQTFVQSGQWSPLELWQKLSLNPALCIGQTVSAIQPQQPAELTLFDPRPGWTVNPHHLKSIARNTPWWNQQLNGRVIKTWCPPRLS